MRAVVAVVAALLIVVVLWDVFETIVLPRRVTRRLRPAWIVYKCTWAPWAAIGRRLPADNTRENFLSYYGPLALLVLLAAWVVALVVGFAALHWALGSLGIADGSATFGTALYFSSTTFITLGLGDVTPRAAPDKVLTVLEAGAGFGLLALVIGYMPALYQSFSRREVAISQLDARGGSPPSAAELIRRYALEPRGRTVDEALRDWEQWSAELLESHLSYPSLAYFRSQHDNQSWLAALTAIMDVCALILSGIDGMAQGQARLTFAMARHAIVDLSQVFDVLPHEPDPDRLPAADLQRMREVLGTVGVTLSSVDLDGKELTRLRHMYEPYVHTLAHYLLMPLPDWLPRPGAQDDWQTSTRAHMLSD